MKRDGGPAFPTADNDAMTLRDYFAGQALAGLCANDGIEFEEEANEVHPIYALHAYKMADAMLAERERE